MQWLILTLISALTLSLTRIFQRVVLKDSMSDSIAFSVVFQLTVSLLFLVFTLVTNSFKVPSLSAIAVNMLIMTLLYSLANLLVFTAFKHAEASEVSILLASSTIWSVVSAVIVLQERLTVLNLLGIACIFIGIVFVNFTRKRWQLAKGHLFALLGAIFFGVAFTNDVFILSHFENIASYMVPAFALPGLATLVNSPKTVHKLPYFFKANVVLKVVLCGGLYAISAITIYMAYRAGGMASIISPIQQTNIILTVILGYLFLKEKDNLGKKSIAATATFIGVLLLI